MANGTVKVDSMATDACSKFLGILNNQLGPAFAQLISNGNTLAMPEHWSGGSASQFQNTVWPNAKADIQKMQQNLGDLHKQIGDILSNIQQAAGNG